MDKSGKYLERLVNQIENYFLPENFTIISNEMVFNDEGTQIAEFDIEISGKLGTTEINWLIECRDRPSQGAAPSSWIEQLVGRRSRFNFSKVTAVSSTGFAKGVKEYAEREGIELRTVKEISLADIKSWCGLSEVVILKNNFELKSAYIIPEKTDDKTLSELNQIIQNTPQQRFISNKKNKNKYCPSDILQSAINEHKVFDDVEVGKPYPAHFELHTKGDNPFFIQTKYGEVKIRKILCAAILHKKEERKTVEKIVEYSHDGKENISQSASINFINDKFQYELNVHNMKESGETIININRSETNN